MATDLVVKCAFYQGMLVGTLSVFALSMALEYIHKTITGAIERRKAAKQ